MIRLTRTTGLVAVSALAVIGLFALLALGASVGGSATAADAGAANFDDHDDNDDDRSSVVHHDEELYTVIQGDRLIPIEPMGDGHQSAEGFYDYRNPFTTPSEYTYSSHGTEHLQEDDTSILMLHDGSDGLSLVIVHDRYDGFSDGGAATFQIDGLPEEGEWVVEDDNYSGTVNGTHIEADAQWEHGEDWSRITWNWHEARTDGGVFNGGLDGDFSIEITPAFNEYADFQLNDGEIDDWQVLSAPEQNPERTSLTMYESIEIRSGGFTGVSELDVDENATRGDETEITATVENTGPHNETVTVPITVDGEVVDEHQLTVDAGETTTVTSTVAVDEAGDVTVSAGDVETTVSVSETDDDETDGLPGFGVLVGIAAVLLALAIGRWR